MSRFARPAAGLAGLLLLAVFAWTILRDSKPPPRSPEKQIIALGMVATGPVDPHRVLLSVQQQKQAPPGTGLPADLKSLIKVPARMQYGDFLWNDRGVPQGPVSIRVDLRTQLLSVFRAGHEIGTAVVLYGADEKETPVGSFPILWKGKDHRSSLYDAPMPYTLRLTGDGVAIHGSDVKWGAATHGCVGVPKEFAAHLFDEADIGTVVTIVRTSPPQA